MSKTETFSIPKWVVYLSVGVLIAVGTSALTIFVMNISRGNVAVERTEPVEVSGTESEEMEEAPDPAELMREKLQKDLETLASIPEEGVCGAAFEYPDVSFALSDDGKSATLQSPDGWQVKCISYRLKGPSSLHDQVVSTRAVDGTRTVEWDEWTATWNYHPDQGIRFIIQHD